MQRLLAQLRVLDHALAEGGDVAADRRERRPQLVRDRHEEVPLELLGLPQPARHLGEALGEVADLVQALPRRHVHVVVAGGDLVGSTRQREDRLRDAPAQVPRERTRDEDAAEEGEGEPLEERHPLVSQLGSRFRDDEGRQPEALDLERIRHGQERPVLSRRGELERDQVVRLEHSRGDGLPRQRAQVVALARERILTDVPDAVVRGPRQAAGGGRPVAQLE